MGDNNYKHGEMDVTDHAKTFDGFVRWSMRVAIFSMCVIVFLAIFAS